MSKAVLESEASTLKRVVDTAAPGAAEVYVRVTEDAIHTVSHSMSAATYATFESDSFTNVEVDDAAEAILRVEDFLTDVDLVADPKDPLTATLTGSPLAETVRLDGRLSAMARLPAAPNLKEEVPLGIVSRFDGDTFTTDEGEPYPTTISTDAGTLARIVSVVDERGIEGRYPITVAQGEFTLDVEADSEEARVWGELAGDVDGPDVANNYGPGFADVVGTLSGDVLLQTEPRGRLVVVSASEERTVRHVIGEMA